MASQPDNCPATLDPISLLATVRAVTNALPRWTGASEETVENQRRAAMFQLATLQPRDALEADLAARYIIAHAQAAENFCAASHPTIPSALKLRLQARGHALFKLADDASKQIAQRQKQAPVKLAPAPAVTAAQAARHAVPAAPAAATANQQRPPIAARTMQAPPAPTPAHPHLLASAVADKPNPLACAMLGTPPAPEIPTDPAVFAAAIKARTMPGIPAALDRAA
jgi:hypothetical protein